MRRRRWWCVACAAMVLPALSGSAEASTIVVSRTAASGSGSFEAAVRKADRDRDLDTIAFARRLRGEVRVPKHLRVKRPVRILGRGFGRPGSPSFERLTLSGPDRGATITFGTHAGRISVSEMYLDRVALSSLGGSLKVQRSFLTGGNAVKAPGIATRTGEGTMRVTDSVVTRFRGGGILADRVSARVERVTVRGNLVFGVASLGEGGEAAVRDSTIAENAGVGARAYPPAELRVVNSTIFGNESYAGTWAASGVLGEATVLHSTITANGGHGAGVSPGEGAELRLGNSIVAGNQAVGTDQFGQDCSVLEGGAGEIRSLGGNLIEDPGNCALVSNDRSGLRPKLGRFRDNGGPTLTRALHPGSPAIGLAVKGNATKRDQRGVKRGRNPDSGAFERR